MDTSSRTPHGTTFAERFEAAVGPPAIPIGNEPIAQPEPIATAIPATELGDGYMVGLLYALATVVGLLGIIGGLTLLSQSAERGLDLHGVLVSAGWIVGGLAGAGALAGLAAMLAGVGRMARQMRRQDERIAMLGCHADTAPPLVAPPNELMDLGDRLDQLARTLDEVSQDCLLDEAGREQKRRQIALLRREQAVEAIKHELSAGQWDRAAVAVDRFRINFPEAGEQAAKLTEELDRRRRQTENDDIAECRRQCEELMSVSAWERAVGIVEQLVAKHPDSPAAKSLAARIDRERRLAADDQRRQLYARIQRHTSRKQWKEALETARQLVEKFPDTVEAEAVKVQMETLAANAEILHRRQIEEEITDLIKRQRFAEAVELSEKVIAEFPASPQAAALREQLPRLKERAEEQAREARKRRVQWE